MKRFTVLGLAFLLFAPALFAENALVMPARIGRVYVVPTFINFDRQFDADGNLGDFPAPTTMFNLGFALEYGINPWITGAVQWTPGVNVWSNVDMREGDEGRVSGMGDLFVGAKFQVLGPVAPITNSTFRVAFAPGVKIPMGTPDFAGEVPDFMREGGVPNVAPLDNHVFAFGLRSFFDWVISDAFYINLFNEVIFHPVRGRFGDLGLTQAVQATSLAAATGGAITTADLDVNFRTQWTFQIEPHFVHRFESPMVAFEAGLPLTYFFTRGFTVEDVPAGIPMPALIPQDQGSVHRLSIGPNVSAFFMQWPVPMEFVLGYDIVLWGQNTPVRHVLSFQIRAYFRI